MQRNEGDHRSLASDLPPAETRTSSCSADGRLSQPQPGGAGAHTAAPRGDVLLDAGGRMERRKRLSCVEACLVLGLQLLQLLPAVWGTVPEKDGGRWSGAGALPSFGAAPCPSVLRTTPPGRGAVVIIIAQDPEPRGHLRFGHAPTHTRTFSRALSQFRYTHLHTCACPHADIQLHDRNLLHCTCGH